MPPNIDIRLKIHKIRLNSDSFLPKSQTKFRLAWDKFRSKLTILWTIIWWSENRPKMWSNAINSLTHAQAGPILTLRNR